MLFEVVDNLCQSFGMGDMVSWLSDYLVPTYLPTRHLIHPPLSICLISTYFNRSSGNHIYLPTEIRQVGTYASCYD